MRNAFLFFCQPWVPAQLALNHALLAALSLDRKFPWFLVTTSQCSPASRLCLMVATEILALGLVNDLLTL